MSCDTLDFIYPLHADIYYPLVEQGAYGNLKKQWVLDKTVACGLNSAGTKSKEDVRPDANIMIDNMIVGRVRCDILESTAGTTHSITNVVVSNVRDRFGAYIYMENSGPRAGKPTLFEIATFNPIVGPFGKVEYYKLVLRRSDNQAVDL